MYVRKKSYNLPDAVYLFRLHYLFKLNINLKLRQMKKANKVQELKINSTLNELREYEQETPEHIKNVYTIQEISEAVKLKENAIFKDAKYWVTMNDNFMSGWGHAKGKTNKLIIACQNMMQAKTIEGNAKSRNEMKYVNICVNKPQIKAHEYPSWKHFEDMGEIWTK